MKIPTHPVFRQIRLGFGLFSIVGLISFVLILPINSQPSLSRPAVKASFVSEPVLPHTTNLPAPEITAASVFVMDMDSGVVLFAKNPNRPQPPASVTKIMTALVAMDHYDDGSVLTVINGDKSLGNTADLVNGDQMVFHDLLYALLVPSGNDAAVTLAENYPGGYAKFVDKMNQKVDDLNLHNTHFSNVSGVEGGNHYSTTYDMAMIALEALKRSTFRLVVSTKDIVITSTKGHRYPLENTNKLLGKPGILGVKTGWTPEAGECLITYAQRNGHSVIISLFGSQDRFGETEKLLDWLYSNFIWE